MDIIASLRNRLGITPSSRPLEMIIDEWFFVENNLNDVAGPDMVPKMIDIMKRVTGASEVAVTMQEKPGSALESWVFKFKYEDKETPSEREIQENSPT